MSLQIEKEFCFRILDIGNGMRRLWCGILACALLVAALAMPPARAEVSKDAVPSILTACLDAANVADSNPAATDFELALGNCEAAVAAFPAEPNLITAWARVARHTPAPRPISAAPPRRRDLSFDEEAVLRRLVRCRGASVVTARLPSQSKRDPK